MASAKRDAVTLTIGPSDILRVCLLGYFGENLVFGELGRIAVK